MSSKTMTECLIRHRSAKASPIRPRLQRLLGRARRTVVTILAIVGFITLARPFTFDLTPMYSPSMAPTLTGDGPGAGGDWILAEKISYYFRRPRRFEIVEFTNGEGLQLMKRVVAVPGETISIKNHALQLDGRPIDPPATASGVPVHYYSYGNLGGGKGYTVDSGLYVLGDNSADSDDSRFNGPVPLSDIKARAWIILWPPSRFGWVR
jgi:signal peptidase I